MEGLLFFGAIFIIFLFTGSIVAIIANNKCKRLEKEIKTLNHIVSILQSQITVLEKAVLTAAGRQPVIPDLSPVKKAAPVVQKEHEFKTEQNTLQPAKNEDIAGIAAAKQQPESKVHKLLEKLEKLSLENWTGIIGVLITIIGIGFLGVFTALKLSEIYRFFMIVAVSLLLLIIYFIFQSSKKWFKLMLWIRSMAAALFLLACAGAGGIPGIRWIDNPLISLVVLCLGISANIILSIVGKKQVVASVHLLLSLASLAIAPQGMVIFIMATIVTLSGVILTFREKWEMHLLFSTLLYFAYIVFYYFTAGALIFTMRITAVSSLACVYILSLFVHYRKVYEHPEFEVKPFFTHLLTWVYLGIGLYLYSPRLSWISIPQGAGAILCFILAHRARALKIRWLFNTDILMSQVIAVIAVICLREWDVLYYPLVCILLIESLVFSIIVLTEREYFLYHCGQWFFYLFSLGFAIGSTSNRYVQESGALFSNSLLSAGCILAVLLYHIAVHYKLEKQAALGLIRTADRRRFNAYNIVCGALAGFFFLLLYAELKGRLPMAGFITAEYLLLLPLGSAVFIRQKIQSGGLGISLLFTLLVMHIMVWQDPLLTEKAAWYEKLVYTLPLFILDLTCMGFSFVKPVNKHLKWPGIYLFCIHLCVVIYFIFNPISPLIPGIAWLLLSVVLLTVSRITGKIYGYRCMEMGAPDAHFLHLGYVCIGAFLCLGYIPVHLQSGQYIWIFKVRLLTEIFALLVFLYWALLKKPEGRKVSGTFDFLHPLFPELIAVFAVFTVAVEVKTIYHPVLWILFGLLALFMGARFKQTLSRFRFHALFLYWASVIHVAFLTSPLATPSLRFFDQTWFFALVAIAFQFGFIVLFYKNGELDALEFPRPLNRLKRFANLVAKWKNPWIYYPLFISIALFLIWSFDASILTLLLTAECFFVFTISIVLKENHFRYLSMAGLGFCMLRLVFYDLASSNILTKAIVCVGVGLLLIGMNMLYNRFSGRYKK